MNNCGVCQKPTRTRCSACKLVFFCSRECQAEGWKAHKPYCKQASSPVLVEGLQAKQFDYALQLIDNNIGILGESRIHSQKFQGALAHAVMAGAPLGIIGKLAERNLDCNDQSGLQGRSPLWWAVGFNRLDVVEYFVLMCKGDIKTKDFDGMSLAHAVFFKNASPQMLQLIVDFGAPINTEHRSGSTPLMMAYTRDGRDLDMPMCSDELVDLALRLGANVNFSRLRYLDNDDGNKQRMRIKRTRVLITLCSVFYMNKTKSPLRALSVDLIHELSTFL